MKPTAMLLACLALAFASLSSTAGPAQVQLRNHSIRMNSGPCSCGFGLVWHMHFSTFFTEEPSQANREIAPLPQPAPRSHWSYMILEDPSMYAAPTYIELDFPDADANSNGINDFFEAGQSVAAGSSGTYVVIWGPGYGQLQFEWNRPAGSRLGSCILTMFDPILGQMGPFVHTFELVEAYTGTLTYTPGLTTVAGMLSIARDGQTPLTSPVTLTRSDTNRFDSLTLWGGQLSTGNEHFGFGDCLLLRHPGQPTNYFATLENPGGSYRSWLLAVTDSNDADGDGIPDLSDDPFALPRRPALSLVRHAGELQLQISGDLGRTHIVEQASPSVLSAWTDVRTLVLTNDPQTIVLPIPETSAAFWRVRAE